MEGDLEAMKTKFNDQVNALKSKKGKNNQLFTRDEYYTFLESVKKTKGKTSGKTPEDYQRLARYDIVQEGNVEKLIVPIKSKADSIITYTYLEENFQIIHETHIAIGHGRRNKMMEELKRRYKNITVELVMIYLNLCVDCQDRVKRMSLLKKRMSLPKKRLIFKPIKNDEHNSRCQIDLIDMQSKPDGNFKYILIYQDHCTKFVQLRALKTKNAGEVAEHLLDIFTTFGAPCVLQSACSRKLAMKTIEEVQKKWDEPRIVFGKPGKVLIEKAKQDIEKMLSEWMEKNRTSKWSEGVKFIQYERNRSHHSEVNCSPYEAMFGHKPKVGMKTSLEADECERITREENLITNNQFYNHLEPLVVISEKNDDDDGVYCDDSVNT